MGLKPPPKKGAVPAASPTNSQPPPTAGIVPKAPPTKAAQPAPRPQPKPQTAVLPPKPIMASSAPHVVRSPGGAPRRKVEPAMVVGKGKVSLSKGGAKVGGALLDQKRAEASAAAPEPECIEDSVLALDNLEALEPPALFRDFIEKITPKLSLADTSYSILKAFSNIDVTAEKVATSLRSNPYYQYHFLRAIEGMGRREEVPSLEGAVVLLGMQNSRNLVIALQLLRGVYGTHAEFDAKGKLRIVPAEILNYALKSEEMLAAHKLPYADTGYAAGLIFDFLSHIAESLVEDKKKIAAYIEAVYLHGLRTAQIAHEVNRSMPESSFSKYVFSSCLVHDTGKIAMAILAPDYLAFLDEMLKKDAPQSVRDFAEKKRFGVHHSFLGSLICHYFRIFRPIEKAVLYHHEPYLLRDSNRNLFQLSSLISLASNVANNFRKVDKIDDPILALWKGMELQDFKVDIRQVMQAVTRVV